MEGWVSLWIRRPFLRQLLTQCTVAKHMHNFGMKIIYYNRFRLSPSIEKECGSAEYVSFDEILVRSDLLSLHCPLNDETKHLLNKTSENCEGNALLTVLTILTHSF